MPTCLYKRSHAFFADFGYSQDVVDSDKKEIVRECVSKLSSTYFDANSPFQIFVEVPGNTVPMALSETAIYAYLAENRPGGARIQFHFALACWTAAHCSMASHRVETILHLVSGYQNSAR